MTKSPHAPDLDLWTCLPLELRLLVALMVLWFRLPHYLPPRLGLAMTFALADFVAFALVVEPHPMKYVAALGSACCTAVFVLV